MNSKRRACGRFAAALWLDGVRWKLADFLSLLACKLRRHPWYRGDCWAGVPGNRAAELRQSVWERCVALEICAENKDPEWLDKIDRELTELGQIAGENWGHINDRERKPSNDQAQRPPPETPGRLQQSLTNYLNRSTDRRGGGSLQRSG